MFLTAANIAGTIAGLVVGAVSFTPLKLALNYAKPGAENTMVYSLAAIGGSLIFMMVTLLVVKATQVTSVAAYGSAMAAAFLVAATVSVCKVVRHQTNR